jgi:hypothetical protein
MEGSAKWIALGLAAVAIAIGLSWVAVSIIEHSSDQEANAALLMTLASVITATISVVLGFGTATSANKAASTAREQAMTAEAKRKDVARQAKDIADLMETLVNMRRDHTESMSSLAPPDARLPSEAGILSHESLLIARLHELKGAAS